MVERFGRTWKLFVMVAAGLGTLSFFMPFLECEIAGARIPASPYRILIGASDVAQIDPALGSLPGADRARLLAAFNATVRHETMGIAGSVTGQQASRIPFFYLSTAALLVIAAMAAARRELGFLSGFGTVGAGLGGVWGWTRELLLIRHSFPGEYLPVALSSGATLFVSASAIALLAGIASLVWADPGGFRARRKILVQLQRGEDPIAVDMPTEEQSAAIPIATLRVRSTRPSDGEGA